MNPNHYPADYPAVHGTSINFVEKLLQTGISTEYLYVLVPVQVKGVDILESAAYYAKINAVKDLLFTSYPQLKSSVSQTIDNYLFLTGLSQLMDEPEKTDIVGLETLTPQDLQNIKNVIKQAKEEDRQGVIVFFNHQFQKDFSITDINPQGQAKVRLTRPLVPKHISGVRSFGNYEKTILNQTPQFSSQNY